MKKQYTYVGMGFIGLALILAVFFVFLLWKKMQDRYYISGHKEATHYKKTLLTPKTISKLMPSLPQEEREAIRQWAQEHELLLHTLVKETENISMTRQEIIKELAASLQALQNNNFSVAAQEVKDDEGNTILIPEGFSYILPVEIKGEKFFVQLSGPVHKKHNLLSLNEKPWEGVLEPGKDKVLPTYQTVSRAAGYLKTKEVAEDGDYQKVEIPKTYLGQIPGRSDYTDFATDANTFIVQEDMGPGWHEAQKDYSCLQGFDEETIKELYAIAKKGVVWDIKDNLLCHSERNKAGISNFQQPNDQDPRYFAYAIPQEDAKRKGFDDEAHYAAYKWAHDVQRAIIGLTELFIEAGRAGYSVPAAHILKELFTDDAPLREDFEKIKYGQTLYKNIQKTMEQLP